jgi:hypothetical protein
VKQPCLWSHNSLVLSYEKAIPFQKLSPNDSSKNWEVTLKYVCSHLVGSIQHCGSCLRPLVARGSTKPNRTGRRLSTNTEYIRPTSRL